MFTYLVHSTVTRTNQTDLNFCFSVVYAWKTRELPESKLNKGKQSIERSRYELFPLDNMHPYLLL